MKAELPDLRAVSLNVVGEDEFGDGLVGGPIELAVKIAGDDVHAFEKILADAFDVGSLRSGRRLINMGTWHGEMAVQVRQFGVEARELELRGRRKPIHGAEKNAGARAVHRHGNGRMSLRLDFIFNRADEDRVFDDGDDDATGREVHDDFFGGDVLNLLGGHLAREKAEG